MDTKRITTILIIGILIGTGTGYGINIPNNTRLQTEIDSLKIEVDKIPRLQQQITTLTNEKSSLQSQLESMKSMNADLREEIESLQSEITAKDDELASLGNRVQQLQDELINAYTRVEWADTLNLEKLAALGLNYVAGDRDYLLDPPWNMYFSAGLLSDPPKMWMNQEFSTPFAEASILLSSMTDSEKGREIQSLYNSTLFDEMHKPGVGVYNFEPYLALYKF